MFAACGQPDCDCGHTIEKLVKALKALCRGHNSRGSDGPCYCLGCLALEEAKS